MSNASLCFIALFLCVTVCADQQCLEGWKYFQESCYFLDNDVDTWFHARSICETVGGYLAEIESAEENAFLVAMMKERRAQYMWMGMEDFVVEGHFVWARFQDRPEYSNWSQGEPNDLHSEDCGSLLHSGLWNDAQCQSKYSFACEKESQAAGLPIG